MLLPILLYFYFCQIFIKWKSQWWRQRVVFELEVKKIQKKEVKSLRYMLKWCNFIKNLEGHPKEGWCMDPIHASTIYSFIVLKTPCPSSPQKPLKTLATPRLGGKKHGEICQQLSWNRIYFICGILFST